MVPVPIDDIAAQGILENLAVAGQIRLGVLSQQHPDQVMLPV
jgi:hypothetical protein